MVSVGDEEILKDKKIKFILEVEKSAEFLNVPKPSVKFWKDRSHFSNGERAHIHNESNLICISEPELKSMNYDEIRTTASHEVAHINNHSHDDKFISTQINTESGLWRPPAGVVHIVPHELVENKEEKRKPKKHIKNKCNEGFCKNQNLKKCNYCWRYFCSEHIEPAEPYLGTDVNKKIEKEKNHSCFGYHRYLADQKKKQDEDYEKALERICRSKSNISKTNNYEKDYQNNVFNLQKSSLKNFKEKDNYLDEENGEEMYVPGRKKYSSYHRPHINFNSKNFFSSYIYPRIQKDVKPHLMQFLLIFLIGIVLNYVYYQTFSINYLFIRGVNEWFNVLIPTLNYGFNAGYDLFYLIINGIFYAYFYYSFVLVIYHTITNLDKRDTWIMLSWFVIILWALIHFFPQIA